MPQIEWLINNRNFFSQFWRLRHPKSRHQQGQVLVRAPFLVHWWLLTISSHSRRGIHGVYLRLLQRHKHSNHSTVVSIMDSECQQTFSTRYTFSCPSTTFSRKWVSVNFSSKCFLLSANTLCIFCSFLTLLRISVQSSLGKCHIALEKYMGYF